jgi:hypothetical protein
LDDLKKYMNIIDSLQLLSTALCVLTRKILWLQYIMFTSYIENTNISTIRLQHSTSVTFLTSNQDMWTMRHVKKRCDNPFRHACLRVQCANMF